MAEENVMDAVNEALGDVITDEPESTPEPESEPEFEDEPEGEPEPESEPEGEPEGDPEDDGIEKGPNGERERNPDGTWKKAEAKKEEPPKKDPVNDPIPENLKKETSERIRSLIDIAKTKTDEATKYKTDFEYLINGVQATGTTPAQYGEALSWLALLNSNDPRQQEKALELAESVADRLSMLLGKERAVGDPLSNHADLKDAVAKGQLTAKYAAEIARTRNGQTFRQEITQQGTLAQQQEQQAVQEEADARAGLTALGDTLASTDPQYAQKKAQVVQTLQPLFRKGADGRYIVPPRQWVSGFQEAYKNLKLPAPASTGRSAIPKNQSLRAGKQPAGGQTRAPSNMLEAINGALGAMNK